MTFFDRAILYLKRKKSRSVLLVAIIFVASSFALSGLALKTAAAAGTETVRKTLGGSFLLKINSDDPNNIKTVTTDTYSYEAYSGEYISKDMIDDISSIEGVVNHTISSNQLVWTNLKLRPGLWADSYKDHDSNNPYTSEEEMQILTQSAMILPCNFSDLHGNFRIGAFSIIDGRSVQDGDLRVAVISDRLAKRNNLEIGDAIHIEAKEGLYQPSDTPSKTLGEAAALSVIGIFTVNFEQEPSVYTPEDEYAENLIYTDWDTGVQMKSYVGNGNTVEQYWEVTFFADKPRELDAIIDQVKATAHFNPQYFVVEPDNTAYRATEKSLNQLNAFAMLLIASGIIGCLAVLSLLLNMWTKNRKREVGILLSMGIKKREILSQLVLECFIVTIAALALAVALSGKLTGALCSFAERAAFPDSQANEYTIETPRGSSTPRIDKNSSIAVHMDYAVSTRAIAATIFATCFIPIASVAASAMQVIRIKPKILLQAL